MLVLLRSYPCSLNTKNNLNTAAHSYNYVSVIDYVYNICIIFLDGVLKMDYHLQKKLR